MVHRIWAEWEGIKKQAICNRQFVKNKGPLAEMQGIFYKEVIHTLLVRYLDINLEEQISLMYKKVRSG